MLLGANQQHPSLSDDCSFDRKGMEEGKGRGLEGEGGGENKACTDAWQQHYNGMLECSHLRRGSHSRPPLACIFLIMHANTH